MVSRIVVGKPWTTVSTSSKCEGNESELLNPGEILINIMSTEMMSHYQLDRKWRRAEFLDLSYLRKQKATFTPTAIGDSVSDAGGSSVCTARSRERADWSNSQLRQIAMSSGGSRNRKKTTKRAARMVPDVIDGDHMDGEEFPVFNGIIEEEDDGESWDDDSSSDYNDDEYSDGYGEDDGEDGALQDADGESDDTDSSDDENLDPFWS